MASHDRREFDKYLKFLTYKVTQVIVQSRQGRKIKTKSAPHGNEWFNVTIQDDKQVNSELKHSLEGRLPQQDSPVCVEISMETPEGESLVLEVWSISLNYSVRDISVSISHLLYPRLSLLLKSLVCLSRTSPAYRLSRLQEDNLKFNYRIFTGSKDDTKSKDFKDIHLAKTSCPYGTISLSLSYRQTIVFPDSVSGISIHQQDETTSNTQGASGSLSHKNLAFPFASDAEDSTARFKDCNLTTQPFAAILPRQSEIMSVASTSRQDSGNSHNSQVSNHSPDDSELASVSDAAPKESDGFILVNIRPSFAHDSGEDMCDFLQSGRDVPDLDLFSSEHSTDVFAAMRIIEDKVEQ